MIADYPTLSHAERDRRWAALRTLMGASGLQALIVFGLKGREHFEAYVANEYIEGVAVLPLDGAPVLCTWHPKMVIRRTGAKTDRSRFWVEDVRIGKYGPSIVEIIRQRGLEGGHVGVVGLEVPEAGCPEGIVPYPMWKAVLDGLPGTRFTDVTWEMRRLMLIKSAEELAVMRHCAAVGEAACRAMVDAVRPGASEHDIYEAIQGAIHRGGAVPHDPFLIMTWGRDDLGWFEPAFTHHGGPPRRIEPGDLVMAELFPAYAGIETQQQMTVAVAPVEPIIEELGRVARACYEAGLSALRPGADFYAVADRMLEPIKRLEGGWTLTPQIHCLAPLGWVAGASFQIENMPDDLAQFRSQLGVVGRRELTIEAGMTFAFEPNACKGRRRVNVGGSIVARDGPPLELNALPNRLCVVG